MKGEHIMADIRLKMGIMKNEELAAWFGIALGTYKNNARGYLEKLQKYADFERIRGGVNITNIRLNKYIKNYDVRDAAYFNKEIERCNKEQDGLASIAAIARKVKKEMEEFTEDILDSVQVAREDGADIDKAQQEIKDMMSKMKLIEEDIKGAAVDQNI